eukprot:6747-Heterococcus_DN1.PRE.1
MQWLQHNALGTWCLHFCCFALCEAADKRDVQQMCGFIYTFSAVAIVYIACWCCIVYIAAAYLSSVMACRPVCFLGVLTVSTADMLR